MLPTFPELQYMSPLIMTILANEHDSFAVDVSIQTCVGVRHLKVSSPFRSEKACFPPLKVLGRGLKLRNLIHSSGRIDCPFQVDEFIDRTW